MNGLGKWFSEWAKCSIAAPRGASPCENEEGGRGGGAFPRKEYGQGKHLLASAIAPRVFPLDGNRQIVMNRLTSPLLLLHIHTLAATEKVPCTHRSVRACVYNSLFKYSAAIRTGQTEGNYFWETYDQNPSLFLQRHLRSRPLGCSAKVQALPAAASGQEQRQQQRSSSAAAALKSAGVTHATHPAGGSNSCSALQTNLLYSLHRWKTALPSLVRFNKNNSILYWKLGNLPGAVIIR